MPLFASWKILPKLWENPREILAKPGKTSSAPKSKPTGLRRIPPFPQKPHTARRTKTKRIPVTRRRVRAKPPNTEAQASAFGHSEPIAQCGSYTSSHALSMHSRIRRCLPPSRLPCSQRTKNSEMPGKATRMPNTAICMRMNVAPRKAIQSHKQQRFPHFL
jgi:hypothetical protein